MTGYMQSMHALVVLQCEASVILLNGAGELLLQRRADNGFWGYHGGSVGLDEAVEEAVARELFEETGLTAHRLTLFGVFSGPALHHVYPQRRQSVEHGYCLPLPRLVGRAAPAG